jgi:DNA-binding CsgD family transcriptional regulator
MAIRPGAAEASDAGMTWPTTFRLLVRRKTASHRSLHREREILALAVTGLTNRQITARLHVTQSTVRTHLSWAFGRLGVHSRGEAVLLLACDERLRRDVLNALDRSAAPALAASSHADMTNANPTADLSYHLTSLVYELLDAHYDTARLAENVVEDERWHAHLAYLRDLQRVAREVLATTTAEDEACASRVSARR